MAETGTLDGRSGIQWQILALLKVDLRYTGRYWNSYILKAIKNATGTSVIFPINTRLIHFVVVLTSVPNVGERFTKT